MVEEYLFSSNFSFFPALSVYSSAILTFLCMRWDLKEGKTIFRNTSIPPFTLLKINPAFPSGFFSLENILFVPFVCKVYGVYDTPNSLYPHIMRRHLLCYPGDKYNPSDALVFSWENGFLLGHNILFIIVLTNIGRLLKKMFAHIFGDIC